MPRRLSQETRWAIISEWKRKPQSDTAIARHVGASHQQVRRIINKYQETGGVSDSPRSGRPRKLKMGDATRLLHRKPEISTRDAARVLSRRVSARTVAVQAKREGMSYRVRPKKPRLTEKKKKARMRFSRQRRPRHFWKAVFASDEHSIQVHSSPRGEWVMKGGAFPEGNREV